MSLYFILLISSIVVPLALSFDKRVAFYRKWKALLPAIVIVAFVFILSDIAFTKLSVWSFNDSYHSSLVIFGLPIEEWLFFFLVPYASLFIHYCFFEYYPRLHIASKFGKILTFALIVFFFVILVLNFGKIYTTWVTALAIILLIVTFFDKSRVIDKFYISFLIILIPFFFIDGIITGMFIEEEIVWYSSIESLAIRVFTIPIEDFVYCFSLVLFNLLIVTKLSDKSSIQLNLVLPKTKVEKIASIIIIIFYSVGIIGMLLDFSRPFFIQLISINLILNAALLLFFNKEKINTRSLLVFAGIFILGLLIEVIGINTGVIFGNYEYGSSLSIKIFGTPIIIGLNWLLLVYTSSSIIEKVKLPMIPKIVISSLIMLIYDVVLEKAAPMIDMWSWKDSNAPLHNYIAWFVIALFFHTCIKLFKVKTSNPMSIIILGCQFVFFVILSLFLPE